MKEKKAPFIEVKLIYGFEWAFGKIKETDSIYYNFYYKC